MLVATEPRLRAWPPPSRRRAFPASTPTLARAAPARGYAHLRIAARIDAALDARFGERVVDELGNTLPRLLDPTSCGERPIAELAVGPTPPFVSILFVLTHLEDSEIPNALT